MFQCQPTTYSDLFEPFSTTAHFTDVAIRITQVRHAHAARQEAQALFAKAKRAVEVAIEEAEDTALKLLRS